MPDAPAFTWVAKSLPEAAEAAGVSLSTLRRAVDTGDLIVHYVGTRHGKPIVRAIDLDEWVRHAPTEPGTTHVRVV